MIRKLTISGILKYGFQLVIVELSTMISIYLIRLIIDYISSPSSYSLSSSLLLFTTFCLFRLVAILARNYYDLHVYNYYKYVENALRCWIYRDMCGI